MTVVEQAQTVTRLTDRGIAVVLTLVVLIVAASIACVGVSAARVTAEPAAQAAATASR